MCTRKELDFSVFLIHHLARAWNKPTAQVYAILNETHIMDDYILPCYETLHTLGEQYLVHDITDYAREKGAAV